MEIKTKLVDAPIGAGDIIKKITSAVGVRPCGGCQKRAEVLNRAVKFVPASPQSRASSAVWGAFPEVPEGWTLVDSRGDALLFRSQDGSYMVWDVVGGKYANAHMYCCSEDSRTMAEQEFETRWRSR